MILYHYDRSGELVEGMTLDKITEYDLQINWFGGKETGFIQEMFPEGLSYHGIHFLSDTLVPLLRTETTLKNKVINTILKLLQRGKIVVWDDVQAAYEKTRSYFIEYNFELVRRAMFPDRPSRYQSLFCVQTPESFEKGWSNIIKSENGKLYQVEVDENCAVKLDASFLRSYWEPLGRMDFWFSAVQNLDAAISYWRGEVSRHPQFEYLVELPVIVGGLIPFP